MKTKQVREADLAVALDKHDHENNRKGKTLPDAQKVYRARVVIALMEVGITLSKLDCPGLREVLEENSYRLTARFAAHNGFDTIHTSGTACMEKGRDSGEGYIHHF